MKRLIPLIGLIVLCWSVAIATHSSSGGRDSSRLYLRFARLVRPLLDR